MDITDTVLYSHKLGDEPPHLAKYEVTCCFVPAAWIACRDTCEVDLEQRYGEA